MSPVEQRFFKDSNFYIFIAIVSFAIFVFGTGGKLSFGTDSASYYSAARNLLDGHGLVITWVSGESSPLVNFPPGYPILLALLDANLAWIYWLHGVVYMLNICLIAYTIFEATHSQLMAGVGSFFAWFMPVLLMIHSVLLTEAIFLL